jgi:ribosomal protein S27E
MNIKCKSGISMTNSLVIFQSSVMNIKCKSGVSMSNSLIIFLSSVMYIKCNIRMKTQNVIHFNCISDMVQVSPYVKAQNHVCESNFQIDTFFSSPYNSSPGL